METSLGLDLEIAGFCTSFGVLGLAAFNCRLAFTGDLAFANTTSGNPDFTADLGLSFAGVLAAFGVGGSGDFVLGVKIFVPFGVAILGEAFGVSGLKAVLGVLVLEEAFGGALLGVSLTEKVGDTRDPT